MSSCTKAIIQSYQACILLHSTCKTAQAAGFILALLNNNLNKYSADSQRTRILVAWFGKATLIIHHLGTCHV